MQERKRKDRLKKSEKVLEIFDKPKIFEKRMNIVMLYQRLATMLVSDPGPNEIRSGSNFEFPSFFGSDSTGIIETIYNGNLEALGMMASEFNLLATVSDRDGMVEFNPLELVNGTMKLRDLPPEASQLFESMGIKV